MVARRTLSMMVLSLKQDLLMLTAEVHTLCMMSAVDTILNNVHLISRHKTFHSDVLKHPRKY